MHWNFGLQRKDSKSSEKPSQFTTQKHSYERHGYTAIAKLLVFIYKKCGVACIRVEEKSENGIMRSEATKKAERVY